MAHQVETAFIIVRDENGNYTALTDMSLEFEPARKATLPDIKAACLEIASVIQQDAVANAVLAKLAKIGQSESQPEVDSPVEE